jgi:hypothetical protein
MRLFPALAKLTRSLLLAVAVGREARKPQWRRTWHGHVAGFVPYDFRRPTLKHVRRLWWDPLGRRVFTQPVFGVGWSINLARLLRVGARR